MKFYRRSVTCGILILATLSACTPGLTVPSVVPQQAANPAPPQPQPAAQTLAPAAIRTLSVSGTGTANLIPDIVHISLGVHTENADVNESISKNNATTLQVKDVLQKYNIQEKDIQTQYFSVYQNQRYDSAGQSTGSYYSVDNTLSVTMRDLANLGKVLGDVTRSGANNISGIQFDLADKSKPTSEARKLALDNANKQAQEMAAALGVTLGNVQSVVIQPNNQPLPMGLGLGGGGGAAASSNVPISLGQLVLTVDLTMVYEIK